MGEKAEKALLKRWKVNWEDSKSLSETILSLNNNCTIVDAGGKVVAWVLPTALTKERQVGFCFTIIAYNNTECSL